MSCTTAGRRRSTRRSGPGASAPRSAHRRPLEESGDTTGYRVVHGENDGLPGLVIDRYDDTYVAKIYTAAWLPHLADVVDGLRRAGRSVAPWSCATVAASAADRWPRWVTCPIEPVPFFEHGLLFEADVVRGQKTGHFLDQRENRALRRPR